MQVSYSHRARTPLLASRGKKGESSVSSLESNGRGPFFPFPISKNNKRRFIFMTVPFRRAKALLKNILLLIIYAAERLS